MSRPKAHTLLTGTAVSATQALNLLMTKISLTVPHSLSAQPGSTSRPHRLLPRTESALPAKMEHSNPIPEQTPAPMSLVAMTRASSLSRPRRAPTQCARRCRFVARRSSNLRSTPQHLTVCVSTARSDLLATTSVLLALPQTMQASQSAPTASPASSKLKYVPR